MSAFTFAHEIDVTSDATTAWCVVADYSNDPKWRTGVRSMTPEPSGLVWIGTTTTEVMSLAGRTWHINGVVTTVTPSTRFEWRTIDGARASGSRSVTRTNDAQCRIRVETTVVPTGWTRLLTPYLRRLLDQNLRNDLCRLKALIEASASRPLSVAAPIHTVPKTSDVPDKENEEETP